jgi:hypothetical protein
MDFVNKTVSKVSEFSKKAQTIKDEYADKDDKEVERQYRLTSDMAKKLALASLLKDRGYELTDGKWNINKT